MNAEELRTTLPESDQPLVREEQDRLQSLGLDALSARARSFTPTDVDRLPRAELTLLRRFALPFATMVFGFLTVPPPAGRVVGLFPPGRVPGRVLAPGPVKCVTISHTVFPMETTAADCWRT